MLAYRLTLRDPAKKVVLIDKGKTLEKRSCPLVEKTTSKCMECQSCSIMNGFAGAGAFYGKFIISTEYGGDFASEVGNEVALHYMEMAEEIMAKAWWRTG